VVHDDPLLTTRLPNGGGVNPLRVVVDSTLQLPLAAQLTTVTPHCRTLVATTDRASEAKQRQLEKQGVEILRLQAYDDGRVDVEALLRVLGERGVTSLLAEGGATLSATLLRRQLIDKLVMFVAPKIIGGDGLSVMDACGVETMDQAIFLHSMTSRQVGEDLMLEAYFMPPDPSAGHAPDRAEEA
jgi:diaminohydroxyphosphoribosylaminopyrimidine deaminase/5-amino-6-(5-phosphoribosylamino)uracil reductase